MQTYSVAASEQVRTRRNHNKNRQLPGSTVPGAELKGLTVVPDRTRQGVPGMAGFPTTTLQSVGVRLGEMG